MLGSTAHCSSSLLESSTQPQSLLLLGGWKVSVGHQLRVGFDSLPQLQGLTYIPQSQDWWGQGLYMCTTFKRMECEWNCGMWVWIHLQIAWSLFTINKRAQNTGYEAVWMSKSMCFDEMWCDVILWHFTIFGLFETQKNAETRLPVNSKLPVYI